MTGLGCQFSRFSVAEKVSAHVNIASATGLGCQFSRFSAQGRRANMSILSRRRAWDISFQNSRAQTNISSGMFVWADHPKLRPVAVAVVAVAVVAVVAAVEAVDKWESYSWCRASPALAQALTPQKSACAVSCLVRSTCFR